MCGQAERDRTGTELTALAMAALADGTSRLRGCIFPPAVADMVEGLRSLGVAVRADETARSITIEGRGGYWLTDDVALPTLTHGDAARLLVALCAVGHARYGVDLADPPDTEMLAMIGALLDLGAQINIEAKRVAVGRQSLIGGTIQMPAGTSAAASEAILTVSPYARTDVLIDLPDGLDLSGQLSLMERFGVSPLATRANKMIVPAPQRYRGIELDLDIGHA